MTDPSPVVAIAMFFDDIRIEVGGKFSLMGQYNTIMTLGEGVMVDRLAIFLHLRWHPDHHNPQKCGVRVHVTGQPPVQQEFAVPLIDMDRERTAFTANIVQTMIQVRFPPLRIGDAIEVWAEVDGTEYPAGRLRIEDMKGHQFVSENGPEAA